MASRLHAYNRDKASSASKKKNKKRYLIILEGPAGVGKTTIQKILSAKLNEMGYKAGVVPEFSDTTIGKLLKKSARYGSIKPDWLTEVPGNLIFLSDKIYAVETSLRQPYEIWICDRFTTTQYVLGLKKTSKKTDKIFAQNIIKKAEFFLNKKFAAKKIFVFLTARVGSLTGRLEKREGRKITARQKKELQDEIDQYNKIAAGCKGALLINSDKSEKDACEEILNNICCKWGL